MKEWQLTEEEISKLSEEDKKKYDTAVMYCNQGWACGPWGGWV